MYTLRFLGTARIDDAAGDAGERLSQPRALALLACLSVAGPDGCTRDKLVGLLWQDLDSRHARHSLSALVHQIRRVLGKEALLTAGGFVRLSPDIVTADVQQFEHAMRAGDHRHAVDLYQGPFLDGFHLTGAAEFGRWVDEERQRFSVRCLEALESLAARVEQEGSLAEAVAWWQRAAQHDPFNSRVALACARALAASGDRGNGVQFLRDHAKRLREELGIDPDRAIMDIIRSGDFGIDPSHGSDSGGVGTSPPPAGAVGSLSPAKGRSPARTELGDQQATPKDDGAGVVPRGRRRWPRRVLVLTAVTVLVFGATMAVRARIMRGHDPNRVVILPTQTVGLDTTFSTLVASHLHAAMADWELLESPTASAVTELWRRAGGSAHYAPTETQLREIAARLGAGLTLASRATRVGQGIELHAALTNAADGASVAAASVTGSLDNLRRSAEALLIRLVARARGIPEDRVATLDTYEPDAVRLYLEAHRVEAAGRDRLLREALERDSTFALGAVALLEASPDYYNQHLGDAWHPIAATAWRDRRLLSLADRVYVEALVGWRFIPQYTAARHVAGWERAVQVAPDRLTHWRGLTLECYRWCSELYRNWWDRALEAHDSLLQRGDREFLEQGLEVAFLTGDTERVRRYAALLPETAWYGRWLAATALERTRDKQRIQRLFEQRDFLGMRVVTTAILTGLNLEEAERAASFDLNSGNTYQLKPMVLARERGRHAQYRELRDKVLQLAYTTTRFDVFVAHDIIWQWAYFAEPESDSVLDAYDAMLSGVIDRTPRSSPDTLATAHCARAQLRVGRGDTTGVGEAVAYLSRDPDVRPLAVSRMCVPLLDLLLVRGSDRDAVTGATRRLNDVLRLRPLDLGGGDGMISVEISVAAAANLELARALSTLGYPEIGLEAVVRRPYRAGLWGLFGFHIDFLLEEARLLAAAGATEQALAKYDLYFRLRPEPPDLDSWRQTWAAAHTERQALLSAGPP